MISAKIPNDIRKGIYRREGYACALCGDPRGLVIHHVVPRSDGGGNSPCNLVCLCRYCHGAAHGVFLIDDYPLTEHEVNQHIVEYIEDMYAAGWAPFDMLDYENAEEKEIAVQMLMDGMRYNGRDS